MTRPPSADELEKLAKIWFAQARELSAKDHAEIEAWKKEHRKWTNFGGSGLDSPGCGDGGSGDCGGD